MGLPYAMHCVILFDPLKCCLPNFSQIKLEIKILKKRFRSDKKKIDFFKHHIKGMGYHRGKPYLIFHIF